MLQHLQFTSMWDIDQEADLFTALEDLKPGDVIDVMVNGLVAVTDELAAKKIVHYAPSKECASKFMRELGWVEERPFQDGSEKFEEAKNGWEHGTGTDRSKAADQARRPFGWMD